MPKSKQHEVDPELLITVFAAISAVLLAWTCLIVYDIKRDVKEIKTTVNEMRQTYSEMLRPQVDKVDTNISAEANQGAND